MKSPEANASRSQVYLELVIPQDILLVKRSATSTLVSTGKVVIL
jgi:hypothetical protein